MTYVKHYNMKKKRIKFTILTSLYFAISVCDLLFTYFATPDLSLEGNPLVTNLQFGWGGLIVVNAITFAVYFAMAYYAYIKYVSPVSAETDDIKRYLADITYGSGDKFVKGMWRWPVHWAPQIACLCYSVATALPFARFVIVIEWFLMLMRIHAPFFFSIVALFPLGRIDFFIAIIIAWILSGVWIKREFNDNKKRAAQIQ